MVLMIEGAIMASESTGCYLKLFLLNSTIKFVRKHDSSLTHAIEHCLEYQELLTH